MKFLFDNKVAIAGVLLGAYIVYESLKLSQPLMSAATILLIFLLVT